MFNIIKTEKLHDAVRDALLLLNDAPVVIGENQDRKERLKELSLVIQVNDIKDLTISKTMPTDLYGLVEYDMEFTLGVRDFEPNWEYTYHRLFNEYLEPCVAELKRDKDTRRAVLPIAGPTSYGNPHPPCLQNIMFKIVNDKLNTTVVFRSNDGVKAFAMNAFAITRLSRIVASAVGVETGEYTHIANSFHAYENDWGLLESYCKRLETENPYYTIKEYDEVYNEYRDEYMAKCINRAREVIK